MTVCSSCATELPDNARFCLQCGAPIAAADSTPAEYKQVTVLFADVVHSMDIAAEVGPERLREIMADLLDRSTAIVNRYGGMVDKFTGDGIMAVFGAPTTLEDHAFRACLAALGIQKDIGASLQLRIGLNSGQVIAGEIGSSAASYTAIGEQVGMAQRMESAAPPGGVMLSESTARLMENSAVLGEPELVDVKGAHAPARARRLLSIGAHQPGRRAESKLVGRTWELNTVTGILDEAISGAGCVVGVLGPPGIGKSRLVRETAAAALARGVPVYTTYCESHARDIPFHVLARLLREGMEIVGLDAEVARRRVHEQFSDADRDDLVLLDDLLGIRDAGMELPEVASDARRRRLTALINTASLARKEPAVYVIEDVHWIDEASELMLTDFLAVIPQAPMLTLITYRPEYRGALTRVAGAQTLSLRPLNDAQATALTAELLGPDPSLGTLGAQVAARAAGNPFFAEELVRDLAEREILHGQPGAYEMRDDAADIDVPATLQATLGARIDRLSATAKQTLNAASVIGSQFATDELAALVESIDAAPLIDAELIVQVKFTPQTEYAFRHPLIRTVAYESQLRSVRQQLHRRIAESIEARGLADENAALIAEHLEAAGDLRGAFEWHMRAGTWLTYRDIAGAHSSWRRARNVADQLPDDEPERLSMRITPRTLLCLTAGRLHGRRAETGFEELRDLCIAAGDQRSLAIGTAGLVLAHCLNGRRLEGSIVGTELARLLDEIGDPTLTVGLSCATIMAKHETGEAAETLHLTQRIIDLADGDPSKGNLFFASPLTFAIALRGWARACLGIPGWRDDIDTAAATIPTFDPMTFASVTNYMYSSAIQNGVLVPDTAVFRIIDECLTAAEQFGEEIAIDVARLTRAIALVNSTGPEVDDGLDLLEKTRDRGVHERFSLTTVQYADIHLARAKARAGDLEGAIRLASHDVDESFQSGGSIWLAFATNVLVEALLGRGQSRDLADAKRAIDRLAAAPTDPGFVINEIWLLRMRALFAQAEGDATRYRDHRDCYRNRAKELGFEGHIAMAEAMD